MPPKLRVCFHKCLLVLVSEAGVGRLVLFLQVRPPLAQNLCHCPIFNARVSLPYDWSMLFAEQEESVHRPVQVCLVGWLRLGFIRIHAPSRLRGC